MESDPIELHSYATCRYARTHLQHDARAHTVARDPGAEERTLMSPNRMATARSRCGSLGNYWLAVASYGALAMSLTGCGSGPANTASPQLISVSIAPAIADVQANIGTQTFTATVMNASDTTVTWQIGGVSGGNATLGTISAAGLYTAPATVPSPAKVTITAVSVADATKSATATVTVTPPVGVSVAPVSASVPVNATQAFTAAVTNAGNTAVTWRVNGIAGGNTSLGTISASGVYRAPASVPAGGAVTVAAVSVADPKQSGSATVSITAPSGMALSLSPRRSGLTTRVPQQFTATVTGSANTSVTWTVDGIAGGSATVGTISASGLYSPPATAGVHTVVATSVADASHTASASVAVTDLAGITTQRYDPGRTAQNLSEYALTPALLGTSGAFGKLFSCAVDGPLYAQPLWVANLVIGGSTHNVVLVATQHDSIYAFDADTSPCHQYWKVSLLGSGETPLPASDTGEVGDVAGEFGVTGTPVIDLASGTLFAVATSKAGGPTYLYRLHALDLATGNEKAGSPAVLSASVAGNSFDPLRHMQRPGLLLVGRTVYIAFGSHGDVLPYWGWLLGYDATTLGQVHAFNFAPHGAQASVWMAGAGPAADASGNIYLSTANGTFDADSTSAPSDDYGDSVVKLATSGGLTVSDYFAPSNQATLNTNDWDLGSSGVVLLPDALGSAAHAHLAITGDKESKLFLIDRDNMGHFTSNGPDRIVQTLLVNGQGNCITCGLFSTPSVWGSHLYVGAVNDALKSYSIANAAISLSPASQSADTYGYPGTNPVISAAGASGAVVWAVDTNSNGTGTTGSNASGPAILRAYDASNLAARLWSSDTNGADAAGNAVKFTVPTVANGKVYLGCQSQLTVYGLQP